MKRLAKEFERIVRPMPETQKPIIEWAILGRVRVGSKLVADVLVREWGNDKYQFNVIEKGPVDDGINCGSWRSSGEAKDAETAMNMGAKAALDLVGGSHD